MWPTRSLSPALAAGTRALDGPEKRQRRSMPWVSLPLAATTAFPNRCLTHLSGWVTRAVKSPVSAVYRSLILAIHLHHPLFRSLISPIHSLDPRDHHLLFTLCSILCFCHSSDLVLSCTPSLLYTRTTSSPSFGRYTAP